MSKPSNEDLNQLLVPPLRIAVVGASPNPQRPSHWISKFLRNSGFTIVPVNPGHDKLFGLTCYPDVESIPEDVDVVNIFRRSDQVLPIVKGTLLKQGVKLIWMQDNVYNEEAAALAETAGVAVVMNDCIFRFLRNR
jgi:predicted CoA-binding protein